MLKETNKNYRQYITSYVSGFIRLLFILLSLLLVFIAQDG